MKIGQLIALAALGAGCAHGQKPVVAARAAPAPEAAPVTGMERSRRLLDDALLSEKAAGRNPSPERSARFAPAAEAEERPGPAKFDYAVALDREGRSEEAAKLYALVAKGQGELAWSAAERAVSLAADRGDFAAARAVLADGEKALPKGDDRAGVLRAELELRAGDAAAAQAIARRILSREPGDVRALCALARAHLRQGQPGTARILAGRAAALDPEDAVPLVVKAEIARAEKQPAAELAALRAAVEADEDSTEAALLLGRALIERSRNGEAVDVLARAAELEPSSSTAQLALGHALELSGQAAEARKAFERAAALSPKTAAPHYDLARLRLDGDGDAQAALEEAKLFLRLSTQAPPPGHPIHALVQRAEAALRKNAQASVVQQK